MPSSQLDETLRPSPHPISKDCPADEPSEIVMATLKAFHIAGQFSSWKALIECIQRRYLHEGQAEDTDAIQESSLPSDQKTGASPKAESRDHQFHRSDGDDMEDVQEADKACHPCCV